MLHCLVAYASISSEEVEEQTLSTAAFIRQLVGEEDYKQLLLMENHDGLRPLELACHLGAFRLFEFLFNTKGVYITKEEEYKWYTITYYDITSYVNGSRFYQSPPYLMMLLGQDKLSCKSVEKLYCSDPVKSWFKVIYNTNMPYLYIWASFRLIYVFAFFHYISNVPTSPDISNYSQIQPKTNTTGNQTVTLNMSVSYIYKYIPDVVTNYTATYERPCHNIAVCVTLLLYSFLGLLWDTCSWIHKVCVRPKWLSQHVQRAKECAVYYTFYRVCQFLTLLAVALVILLSLGETIIEQQLNPVIRNVFVLMAVFLCVWDVLYFLQLTPALDVLVVAVQCMLKAFCKFGFLFILFFVPYVFGFANLYFGGDVKLWVSIYRTFLIILNMEDFSTSKLSVCLLHVSYIFMIVILLLNFLIAILSSTFEQVRKHRNIIMQLQYLSVTLVTEEIFLKLFPRFHTWLRRRYACNEGNTFFVTKVSMKPRHV